MLGDAYTTWSGRTVIFSWDAIFVAAGAITGMRVCTTMLISGTLCWAVFVPMMQAQGVITGNGFRDIVQWTLWGGTACMVSGGLLSFLLQWKSVVRAFRSLTTMFSRKKKVMDEMEAIETPMSWFAAGQLISLVALAYLAHASFNMPYWQSVLAVLLSFALALVACRITGETDTTPIGAMGKVTQLTFGVVNPGNINVNLMSANITAAAAASSADLLTDLKSGYLLGANPRRQFLAQFAGIFVGTLVTVFAFRALVPDASVLGTEQFPAPAAQTWAAVAKALSKGLSALEPLKVWSIVVGGFIGIVLALLPVLFPKRQKYFPSASAAGLAWVFHWYYGILFFLGAVIAFVLEKKSPQKAEEYTFPVASGIIAGGSLMGVVLVFWANGPELFARLFGK
jgi:OPT family oligopeptide transporter